MLTATEVEDEYLTEAAHRMTYCDACGPAVTARTHIIIGDSELKYCFHHTSKYAANLRAAGAFIYDIR